jgi:acetone carboxylase beta subunit
VPKPRLSERNEGKTHPDDEAHKGNREIFWDSKWHNANLWEMGLLESGNVINGPAVIEAPATTLLVPPKYIVKLDKYRIFHMEGE